MNVDIKIRDEMKSRFGKILPANSIEQIENSIHKFSIDYASVNETPYLLDQIYDTKGDEILKLMKDPESDYFITAIKNKKIDLGQIAFLKPDELNPEKYNKIIKKKALEEYKKSNQATSNVFECRKCKNKKCQVTQRQTRAADEPATTFVTCMECGYEFSFN